MTFRDVLMRLYTEIQLSETMNASLNDSIKPEQTAPKIRLDRSIPHKRFLDLA